MTHLPLLLVWMLVASSVTRGTVAAAAAAEDEELEYTSLWVVRVSEPESADKVAVENGYRVKKMVSLVVPRDRRRSSPSSPAEAG